MLTFVSLPYISSASLDLCATNQNQLKQYIKAIIQSKCKQASAIRYNIIRGIYTTKKQIRKLTI